MKTELIKGKLVRIIILHKLVREKSRAIINLLDDKERLMEERRNYSKWKSRIEGVGSGGHMGSISSSS